MQQTAEGRNRVVIEGVKPESDAGRFAIKRTLGGGMAVSSFPSVPSASP